MKQYIYKITILTTNKSYIGLTNSPKRRLSQHKHLVKIKSTDRKNMYIDWQSGGLNNYTFEILNEFEFESKKNSFNLESYYINLYNTANDGYNVCSRSSSHESSQKGVKLSEEIKRKVSENHANCKDDNNPFAKEYVVIDNEGVKYYCETRKDICNKLNVSFKQAKSIIAANGEWHKLRFDDRCFKLVSKKFINIDN